jgi:purine-nucleoside phosphorylase
MSTVIETIAARARGARVIAASLITNVHDGAPTTSEEVMIASANAAGAVAGFMESLLTAIP